MSENLIDLSGKIDDATVELLETISQVAQAVGVPFFVVCVRRYGPGHDSN